uniref:DDE_3 domain-containing protein n=1 Tax=Strongyloides stercoralis TaxID=6248 RepID=A0A0K0EGZ1_STRER
MDFEDILYFNEKRKRRAFCEWLFEKDEFNFNRSIYYSDEAVFYLNGHVNKHDVFIWATENPSVIIEEANTSQRFIVWVLIGYNGIVKYKIFETTVTADVYEEILEENVIPFFTRRGNDNLIFQQDGAPAHFARRIRGILNENLENRWIGRGSHLIEWPSRSPDLTVCDYFLWGYLKNNVYLHNVTNLNEFKNAITEEITKMPIKIIRKAVDNIVKR